MEQTKVKLKWFTIPQYRQEEEFLSSMHKNGWRLTKVTFPGFYHFTKCEPENVTYRLDYNQEGIANKAEYVQMFADCGWEYLFDFVGYSYFRKASDDVDDKEEIFCDDHSRLDMMRRVFRGRVVPLIIIFFGIILPQLFSVNHNGFGGGSIVRDVLSYLFLGLGLLYILLFSVFAIQFYQYEKSISSNRNLKIKYGCIFAGLIAAVIAMVVIMIGSHWSYYEVSETECGFVIEAALLNGTIEKEYDLNPGDTIHVTHEGTGGELYISIGQEGTHPSFYGNTYDEFETFSVEIEQGGVYRIKCSGKRARGTIEVELIRRKEYP